MEPTELTYADPTPSPAQTIATLARLLQWQLDELKQTRRELENAQQEVEILQEELEAARCANPHCRPLPKSLLNNSVQEKEITL